MLAAIHTLHRSIRQHLLPPRTYFRSPQVALRSCLILVHTHPSQFVYSPRRHLTSRQDTTKTQTEKEIYYGIRERIDEPEHLKSHRPRFSPHLTQISVPLEPPAAPSALVISEAKPLAPLPDHTGILNSIVADHNSGEEDSPEPRDSRISRFINQKVSHLGGYLDHKIEENNEIFERRRQETVVRLSPGYDDSDKSIVTQEHQEELRLQSQVDEYHAKLRKHNRIYKFFDNRLNQLEHFLDRGLEPPLVRLDYINDRYMAKAVKYNNLERQFLNRSRGQEQKVGISKGESAEFPSENQSKPVLLESATTAHTLPPALPSALPSASSSALSSASPSLSPSEPYSKLLHSIISDTETVSDSHVKFNRVLLTVKEALTSETLSEEDHDHLQRTLGHYYAPVSGNISRDVLFHYCSLLLHNFGSVSTCVRLTRENLPAADLSAFWYRLIFGDGDTRARLSYPQLSNVYEFLRCLGSPELRNHIRTSWMYADRSDNANLVHILEHDYMALNKELDFAEHLAQASLQGDSQFEVMNNFYELLRTHYHIHFNELIDMNSDVYREGPNFSRDNWRQLSIPFRVYLLSAYLQRFSLGYLLFDQVNPAHVDSIQKNLDHVHTIVFDIFSNDSGLMACEGVLDRLLKEMVQVKRAMADKLIASDISHKRHSGFSVNYRSVIEPLLAQISHLRLSERDFSRLIEVQGISQVRSESVKIFLPFAALYCKGSNVFSKIVAMQFTQCQESGMLHLVLDEASQYLSHLDDRLIGDVLLAGYSVYLTKTRQNTLAERELATVRTVLGRMKEKSARILDYFIANIIRKSSYLKKTHLSDLTRFTEFMEEAGLAYKINDQLFDSGVFTFLYLKYGKSIQQRDVRFFQEHFSLDQQFRLLISFTNKNIKSKKVAIFDPIMVDTIFANISEVDPATVEANKRLYAAKILELDANITQYRCHAKGSLSREVAATFKKLAAFQDFYNQKLHSLVTPVSAVNRQLSRLASVCFFSNNKLCEGPVSKPVSNNPRDYLKKYRGNVHADILAHVTVPSKPTVVINPDVTEICRIVNSIFHTNLRAPLKFTTHKYTTFVLRLVDLYMVQHQFETAFRLTEGLEYCPTEVRALVLRRLASVNPEATRQVVKKIIAAKAQGALPPQLFHDMCLGVIDSPHLGVTAKHRFFQKLQHQGMLKSKQVARKYIVNEVNVHLQAAYERGKGSVSRFASFVKKAEAAGVDPKFINSWLLFVKHMKVNRMGYWTRNKMSKTQRMIKKRAKQRDPPA
ncbi:hypothetical protein BABINDRAFT_163727 [Babjeviella inositovora NRRL Y-12698]|uniref:Uncharacterized protein n=1 Tax=Babjeviella inositovora NRRL Y-12698 TaxID=984486 RepID=A0A1E3QJQ2_9ASCO|nr:uncharacterized protein BABINDRAFT_163727 [Babjeviella inositovora NRRL Y-12698]ODQ77227.1 hypothetical protein BABINDRAFT_163727 [Babjeviella inositovora NRRL Y-12698]